MFFRLILASSNSIFYLLMILLLLSFFCTKKINMIIIWNDNMNNMNEKDNILNLTLSMLCEISTSTIVEKNYKSYSFIEILLNNLNFFKWQFLFHDKNVTFYCASYDFALNFLLFNKTNCLFGWRSKLCLLEIKIWHINILETLISCIYNLVNYYWF